VSVLRVVWTGSAHLRPLGEASAPPRQPAHAPAGTTNGTAPAGERAPKRKPKPKGPSKNRVSAQQKAEQAIEAAEASLRELEAELTDPAAWATRYEAAKSEARHTAATRAVETAYAQLEALVD
jgi:ATP-binding cassette, subfamily F, member 3